MSHCLSMYSEIQLTIKENTQQARQAIPISFDPDTPFRVINHFKDCISIFLNYFFSMHACMLSCFSCVQLFAPSQIVAHLASLLMGILQARILEWVAMPSSKGSSQPRDRTQVSCFLHWQAGSLPLVPPRKPCLKCAKILDSQMEGWC